MAHPPTLPTQSPLVPVPQKAHLVLWAVLLYLNQNIIVHYLYIVIWKSVKVINDEYCMVYLNIHNLVVTFVITVIHYMLGMRSRFLSMITLGTHMIEPRHMDTDRYRSNIRLI